MAFGVLYGERLSVAPGNINRGSLKNCVKMSQLDLFMPCEIFLDLGLRPDSSDPLREAESSNGHNGMYYTEVPVSHIPGFLAPQVIFGCFVGDSDGLATPLLLIFLVSGEGDCAICGHINSNAKTWLFM